MIRYRIDCHDITIAYLEIKDGMHRCIPVPEGLEHPDVQKVSIPYELKEGQDWGGPIPFLQNKINDAVRFGRENNIGSFTDPFRLVMIDE